MLLKNNPEYQKLPVGQRGLLGSTSYWLSGDHLLLVETTGYSERYRRYRLDQIKAVYASRTSRRLWINLVAALLFCLLGGVPLLASGGNPASLIWGGLFAVLFGTILLVNSARGPTCSAQIVTSAQTSPLRGITRLARVEPLIAALRAATGPIPSAVEEAGPADAATVAADAGQEENRP